MKIIIKRKQKKSKYARTGTRGSAKMKIVIIIIAKKIVNVTSMVENAGTKIAKKGTERPASTGMEMGAIEKKCVLISTRKPMSQENVTKKCTEVEVFQEVAEEACLVKEVQVEEDKDIAEKEVKGEVNKEKKEKTEKKVKVKAETQEVDLKATVKTNQTEVLICLG